MTEGQLWVSTAEVSAFFALVALAYYLTYLGAGFFNFAIGAYAMAGAMTMSALVFDHGWSRVPAFGAVLLAVGVLSVVTEVAVIRPVQRRTGRGELPALVAVAAVLFAIQQLAGVLYGFNGVRGVPLTDGDPVVIGDVAVRRPSILLVAACLLVFVVVATWLSRSRTGRMMRAVGDAPAVAVLLGLPVGRVRVVVFAIAGAVAALAGLLYAAKNGVSTDQSLSWSLVGFLAFVVGGTGNVWAPLLGAVLFGMAEVFIPYYFGGGSFDYVLLLVGLLFFAFRPQGLLSRTVRA